MKSTIRYIAKRLPLITLCLTAVSLAVHFFHPIRPHLLYTRANLLDGEFWRLVTCHWVHLNTDHLLWSTSTFLLLGAICEIINRRRYLLTVGLSSILIPTAIWVGTPNLQVYGGLSGLDCALYSLVIVMVIRLENPSRNRIWKIFYAVMLILLPAKIIYEMTSGLTYFVNNAHTEMVPVPLSHLVGGIVGILGGIIEMRKSGPKDLPVLDLHIPGPAGK